MLCPCCKYESGLKKTGMHMVRQITFYCRTCKNHAKLWLMHSKVFERESKTNNEHTVAVLYQRHDFILLYHFFILCFLIRNFNSFCSFFITVTDLRILTNMLIPGTTLIKNGLSFPPPCLFWATRLFGMSNYHMTHQKNHAKTNNDQTFN